MSVICKKEATYLLTYLLSPTHGKGALRFLAMTMLYCMSVRLSVANIDA